MAKNNFTALERAEGRKESISFRVSFQNISET